MPILSPKTGALREAVLAGELSGRDLLVEKREFHLKAEQPGEWTDAATGRHYEVVGREADGDLVTFFVRAWTAADKKTQLAFGRPGRAVGIERFRFQNIPTLTEDPLGGFEECGTDPETGLIQTRPKLIEDPLLVARELVRQQVGLTARIDPSADFKAIGRTVTTFYPAAGANSPVDGEVFRSGVNQTFATIQSTTGNGASVVVTDGNIVRLQCSTTSNQFSNLTRSVFCFDTSVIGSGGTISAATISFYGTSSFDDMAGSNPSLNIVSANPSNTNNLTSADYTFAKFGTTVYASVGQASFSTSGYNDMALDSNGIANIDKAGISKFGTRYDWDVTASFGGTWGSNDNVYLNAYFADQTGTTNDPKLTVTHEAAAGATSREPQPARFKNGRWHYYGRC